MTDKQLDAVTQSAAVLSAQLEAAGPLVQRVKAAGPEHDLAGAQLLALLDEAVNTAAGLRMDLESWADAVLP